RRLFRRGFGSVLRGGKRAALVALSDRIFRFAGFGGEDFRGVGFGIVLRPIAQAVRVRIVVPRALVVRDAVDDLEADTRVLKADAGQLRVVARADPDRQAPAVDRLRSEIADPRAQKPDAVLVGIEAGERLGKRLADAVTAIGARHDFVIDRLGSRVEADGVV